MQLFFSYILILHSGLVIVVETIEKDFRSNSLAHSLLLLSNLNASIDYRLDSMVLYFLSTPMTPSLLEVNKFCFCSFLI